MTCRGIRLTRLLLITLLVLSSATAYAEWVLVAKDKTKGGMTRYVELDTILREGERVKMWALFDYKTVQTKMGALFLSKRGQRQFDCIDKRTRLLSVTWFLGNMGTGDISWRKDGKHKWQPVPPGSGFQHLWTFACGKQ
jgi:hypothetical protein